jgi:transposase
MKGAMMAKKKVPLTTKRERRTFTDQFKQDAVQMLLDGHSVASVSQNLGIGNTNLLYRWKADLLARSGPAAQALDSQVLELRDELQRTKRERDILKKALAIFSQQE